MLASLVYSCTCKAKLLEDEKVEQGDILISKDREGGKTSKLFYMHKVLLLVFISLPFSATAQTEAEISKHRLEIIKNIEASIEQGFEGSLYNNRLIINKTGKSWPAVGVYSDSIDFWYNDPPDHLSAEERDPVSVLVRVETCRQSSTLHTDEDYFYKEGNLFFYYEYKSQDNKEWETFIYFDKNKMAISSVVKTDGKNLTGKDFTIYPEYAKLEPDIASIFAEAKRYQDLFFKTCDR